MVNERVAFLFWKCWRPQKFPSAWMSTQMGLRPKPNDGVASTGVPPSFFLARKFFALCSHATCRLVAFELHISI